MLIELGRQIPKQPHPKSMHGRFHGQNANAVREKQSMKPTGHQAILVHNPEFLTSKISGDRFLFQRFFNPVSLASSGDPRAAEQIHEVTAQARADDSDGLRPSALLLSHGEAAHRRQDPQTRRQDTVICPRCKKLVSPPERLAEHFPRCERRPALNRSVLFR